MSMLRALIVSTLARTLLSSSTPAFAAERPNIVIILADEPGYAALGVHGCKDIPTPHIDSIAKGGVRFTQAYVTSPICSPTRAGLLTGRYQQRFGFEDNGGPDPEPAFGLPLTEATIAESLSAAGYRTAIAGKWDVGIRDDCRPTRRGFDEFFGFLPGVNDYIRRQASESTGLLGRPLVNGRSAAIFRNSDIVDEPEYLTDAFGREAGEFVRRSKGQPFLLYVAFNAVHNPMSAPEKYENRFAELQPDRRIYAAMVSAMDDAVGEIIHALRDTGAAQNTVIVFLSDNGGASGRGFAASSPASNAPLGGRKGTFWEGGIRVPLFIAWPGRIPEGSTIDQLVSSLDIVPTALDAAQAQHVGKQPLDGKSLLPLVRGQTARSPHDALFWRYHDHFAIRQGDWKLIVNQGRPAQLFDLSTDIGETKNLADARPEVVQRLRARLHEWASELPEPAWVRRQIDPDGSVRFIPLPIYEPAADPTR